MQPVNHYTVRPTSHQKLEIPLAVRSVGHYLIDPTWKEKLKKKWFLQLFWAVKGQGEFLVDETQHSVEERDIFIYRPGESHAIKAITPQFDYYWITWDHPDSLRWIEAFGLRNRVHRRGPCPKWLFEEVEAGLQEGTPEGERRSAHAAHALLIEASIEHGHDFSDNPLAAKIRSHLDAHFRDQTLTMESLATTLKIHRTTLFRAFQNTYRLTPSLYLYNRRIQNALSLLHRSELRIQEVAWKSGFSDANYFSRAVKQATGVTPREFRAGTPRPLIESH